MRAENHRRRAARSEPELRLTIRRGGNLVACETRPSRCRVGKVRILTFRSMKLKEPTYLGIRTEHVCDLSTSRRFLVSSPLYVGHGSSLAAHCAEILARGFWL
jgi:hypothetical protein